MYMKQFVFMILGGGYQPQHRCRFEPGRFISRVETVQSFEEAKRAVLQWQQEGVGVIECCGAFSAQMVDELRRQCAQSVPISACVHYPFQNALFDRFFGKGACGQEGKEANHQDYVMMMMDEGYRPEVDCALFEMEGGNTRIETVRNLDEAKHRLPELMAEGVGLVECCGAFSEGMVQELIQSTGENFPIAYMHTEKELLPQIEAFFYED